MGERGKFLVSGALSLAYAFLLFVSIYLVFTYTLGSIPVLTWTGYGYSELLINYDAGFVRRGLLGAIIKRNTISECSSLLYVNRLVFSNFLMLALFTTILNLISRKRSSIVALLVLTLPGGILSMALSNEYFYRKEILFYIALSITACLVCTLQYLDNGTIQRGVGYAAVFLIFATSLVLPFVHESFLFLSTPAHAFLLYAAMQRMRSKDSAQKITDKLPAAMVRIYLSVQAIIFLLLSYYKGNSMLAQSMWDKLLPADRTIISPTAGLLMGAIGAIGWSLPHALWMTIHVIISGLVWYWLVPLVGGFVYCLSLTLLETKTQRSPTDTFNRTSLWVGCYFTLLIATLPMFLLGWDWGRWILAINFSFVILWLAIEPQYLGRITNAFLEFPTAQILLQRPAEATQETAGAFAGFWLQHRRTLIALMLLFSFTFRVPECCLGGSWPAVSMATQGLKRIMRSYRQSAPIIKGESVVPE
jgi:hypothetical protein